MQMLAHPEHLSSHPPAKNHATMIAHVLSVLGLAVYAHEVYRTIQNFGVRRRGLAGAAVANPAAHMGMAILLACLAWFWLGTLPAVPVYVGPIAALISLVYLGAACRFWWQQSRRR